MSSIMVLVIAFGLGCITGIVVHVLSHNRRTNDSARAAVGASPSNALWGAIYSRYR